MRLGPNAPALCPDPSALGRIDKRGVNSGNERMQRRNVRRKEYRTERKEKMIGEEKKMRRWLDGCLTPVGFDTSIFFSKIEAWIGRLGR